MPLPNESRELALCDGGMILLEYPRAHRALAEQLHRLLVPGGRAIFRLFVPPQKSETKETVLDDLAHGRIANLNILKLRLGMAMQPSVDQGVAIDDVLRAVESVEGDLPRLAQRLGWTWDHMRVIEAYRNSPARYHFVSEAQLTKLFCHDGRFAPLGRWQGSYPLAERCPIVAFERQRSPA
jgi:SAM-dependent methyltransferase